MLTRCDDLAAIAGGGLTLKGPDWLGMHGDWFVVATFARAEWEAFCSLRDLGFAPWYPTWTESVSDRQRGKRYRQPQLQPHLPGYVFALVGAGRSITQARGKNGVCQVVSWGGRPEIVPPQVIVALRERLDPLTDRPVQGVFCPLFEAGRRHRISNGPFEGFVALIERIVDKERITVWADVFGRQTSVTLPATALGPAL